MHKPQPEDAIIAAKLFYFVDRGYRDIAVEIMETAHGSHPSVASSLAMVGQMRAFCGRTDAAVDCLILAVALCVRGSQSHTYTLILLCQTLLVAGNRERLDLHLKDLYRLAPLNSLFVELQRRKYDPDLAIGSLAGAGSLGFLIPSSIVLIIYGILAEVSITKLFAAGVVPGLLVSGLYSGYIIVRCLAAPDKAPSDGSTYGFKDCFWGIVHLLPILSLMFIVLGAIYSGLATPSEAAAVGVAATIFVALMLRQLSFKLLCESLMAAIRTYCMVCIILIAAAFLSTTLGYLHIPINMAQAIAKLEPSPFQLIAILSVFYILFGMFLDGISIIVMSLPITLPLALLAGFDPIWFGIYLVLMVQLAQVTPPIGFYLFVLQTLTGEPIGRVAWAALPFFLLMCAGVAIITVFPQIALWLPSLLG